MFGRAVPRMAERHAALALFLPNSERQSAAVGGITWDRHARRDFGLPVRCHRALKAPDERIDGGACFRPPCRPAGRGRGSPTFPAARWGFAWRCRRSRKNGAC